MVLRPYRNLRKGLDVLLHCPCCGMPRPASVFAVVVAVAVVLLVPMMQGSPVSPSACHSYQLINADCHLPGGGSGGWMAKFCGHMHILRCHAVRLYPGLKQK